MGKKTKKHKDKSEKMSKKNKIPETIPEKDQPNTPAEENKKVFSDLKALNLEIERQINSDEMIKDLKFAEENIKNLFTIKRVNKAKEVAAEKVAKKHSLDKDEFKIKFESMTQNIQERIDKNFIISRVINSIINADCKIDELLEMKIEELSKKVKAELKVLSKSGEALLEDTLLNVAEPLAQMISLDKKEKERVADLNKDNQHLKNENDRLRTIANERAELVDSYKKDCVNIKKKSAEREKLIQQNAAEKMSLDLLPTLDSFDRALTHKNASQNPDLEGFKAIYNQMIRILEKHGVTVIDSDNQEFDANIHEAIFHLETNDFEEGMIVETAEKGYMINESVLRHARVVVAKKPA